jgi:hypothetical protein
MVEGVPLGMSEVQQERVRDLLMGYLSESPVILNGLCVGADAQAHTIARELKIPIIGHPGFEVGNKWRVDLECDELRTVWPPKVRDKMMVREGRVCIATPCSTVEEWRGGTWLTFHYAQEHGLKWHCVWPDGSLWEGPFQRVRLTEDVEPAYGLRYGVELAVYDGPGQECGAFDVDEKENNIPNGKIWVRCPTVPRESIWRSPYRQLKPTEFELITTL